MTLMRNLRNRSLASRAPAPAPREPVQAREAAPAPTQPPAQTSARTRTPRTGGSIQGPILSPVLIAADGEAERVREGGASAVHVHGLLHSCGRMLQLAKQSPIPLYQARPTGGHRVMWAIGKALEHHVRSTYITAQQGVNIRGNWTCPCEQTHVVADVRPNDPCHVCGMQPHVYKELVLHDPEFGVRGSPDFVLLLPQGYTVVEIKSKKADGADGYDALTEPEGPHVEQASLYRRLLQRQGLRVSDFVVIIYVTKDFRYGVPYKEFMVPTLAGSHWDTAVDHLLEKAREINSRQLMPRLPACTAPHKPVSKACPTCVDCFARAT